MNHRLASLIVAVTLAGAAVLAYGGSGATTDDLGVLLALLALGAFAERYAVGLFDSDVSVGVAAVLVAALIAGFWGVALVAPLIVLTGQLGSDTVWYKRVYNASVYVLAGGAFAGCVEAFGPDMNGAAVAWSAFLVPLVGAVAHFAVNSTLIALAIAVRHGESPLLRWRRTYLWLLPQYLLIGGVAISASAAYTAVGVWGVALLGAPLIGVRQAFTLGARTERADRDQPHLPRAA